MKTIMIVDDEKDIRDTTKQILENEGFKVITAVSGDDLIEKLGSLKKDPDLILLDIMMPGTPVAKIVSMLKGLKVVFFSVVRTTEAEKEDLMKSKNVVGYIQKPYDIDELVKKIRDIVK